MTNKQKKVIKTIVAAMANMTEFSHYDSVVAAAQTIVDVADPKSQREIDENWQEILKELDKP